MKIIFRYLPAILLFGFGKISFAQVSSLSVNYTYTEKGNDSRSSIESFNLKGNVLSYAVKHTGKHSPDQKDDSKIIRLTADQANTINNVIGKYKLDVSDSIIDNSPVVQIPVVRSTLIITVARGNQTTKIKVDGDGGALEDNALYANAYYLLGTIRQMMPGAH